METNSHAKYFFYIVYIERYIYNNLINYLYQYFFEVFLRNDKIEKYHKKQLVFLAVQELINHPLYAERACVFCAT